MADSLFAKPGIYAILDLPYRFALATNDIVDALGRAGVRHLQVRAKRWTTDARVELLQHLAPQCARLGVPLWVNDDVEAALAGVIGVTGVHLGQRDLGDLDVKDWSRLRAKVQAGGLSWGLSTHDLDEVMQALPLQPTYLGFGPIFPTHSKENPEPTTGCAALAQALKLTDLPIVAIGGLEPNNLALVAATGVGHAAMISALVAPELPQIEVQARHLCRLWDDMHGGHVSR